MQYELYFLRADFGSRGVTAPARFTLALFIPARGGLFTGRHISTTPASGHGTAFRGSAADSGLAKSNNRSHGTAGYPQTDGTYRDFRQVIYV